MYAPPAKRWNGVRQAKYRDDVCHQLRETVRVLADSGAGSGLVAACLREEQIVLVIHSAPLRALRADPQAEHTCDLT